MDQRALLTERERELLRGKGEDQHRWQAKSKVKRRISDELQTDVRLLEEYEPELMEAIRDVVCSE